MAWTIEVNTKHGDRRASVDTKEEADAALGDVRLRMGKGGTITIADQLVVKAADVTSARIYETGVLVG